MLYFNATFHKIFKFVILENFLFSDKLKDGNMDVTLSDFDNEIM